MVGFGFSGFVGRTCMFCGLSQLGFFGGEWCRSTCLAAAVQSALHWKATREPAYLKPIWSLLEILCRNL